MLLWTADFPVLMPCPMKSSEADGLRVSHFLADPTTLGLERTKRRHGINFVGLELWGPQDLGFQNPKPPNPQPLSLNR